MSPIAVIAQNAFAGFLILTLIVVVISTIVVKRFVSHRIYDNILKWGVFAAAVSSITIAIVLELRPVRNP